MAVAQLAERSLATPEACSSNPAIVKIQHRTHRYLLLTVVKTKKQGPATAYYFKKPMRLGRSLGLVVMGGDSCSEGREFESQHRTLDGN